ncbi:copper transporter 1-like [Nicotiana tomentosiformis]|uniref:copper transporter 1-like n=1 Tax=Nicotiana tomentosiformis TaxID=4098 RepID=UPI00051B4C01|nr:copper transporter 1-like [Nicotiana tomentosiformis]XP_016513647.1 PREDICTED: copper transporter 1-like [Nicotiana tabacum]
MNNGGHMQGMAMAPPPSAAMNNATGGGGGMMMKNHRHMMMHMTFFWGKNTEILFSNWPGYDNLGMYVLALFVVFFMAVLVEFLSHGNYIKENADHVSAGLIQTTLYGLRIGLAYVVMLAVMSFNGGVFLVAIFGHMLGFLVFGSRVFNKSSNEGKTMDLPPMSCSC